MITRFFYTFPELLETAAHPAGYYNKFISEASGYYDLMTMIHNAGGAGGTIGTDTTQTATLLKDYIWPIIYQYEVGYMDIEHEPWTEVKKPTGTRLSDRGFILGRMYSWIKATQPRYEKLIKLYESEESNLMNAIKSSSTTAFNDTPQVRADGSDPLDGDEFITNLTKVTSESDGDTIIARLDEVRRKMVNLYQEWSREFCKEFVIY